MFQGRYEIIENKYLNKDVLLMKLKGNTASITKAGQFLNIKIEGKYLRRPISIADHDDEIITIIYRIVGNGTQIMADLKVGTYLDVIVGLGNGFDYETYHKNPVLVGGGIGCPPMLLLAKKLLKNNIKPQVILGFNSKEEVFGIELFNELGIEPIITTVDGSYGIKGYVTDAFKEIKGDYIYACGPEPMFKALYKLDIDGEYSFEARMGCGYGACMGCTCETITGYKRICKEGPIIKKEEIIWN